MSGNNTRMTNHKLFQEVKDMRLPEGTFVLFGSTPMGIRGIKESRDADILLTEDVWGVFARDSSWERGEMTHGSAWLRKGNIELWKDWKPGQWDVRQLIDEAEVIDGLPFVSLGRVLEWKKLSSREKDLKDIETIENFLEKESLSEGSGIKKFHPKPGQKDFTSIRYAPVVNCVLFHEGKILLVKRSGDLKFYPNVWNGISGFLDDEKDFDEKVKEEIFEEVGVTEENIISIRRGEIFHQDELAYGKTWIVHPVMVKVKSGGVTLGWEAQQYQWLSIDEAKMLDLLPGFDEVLKRVEKMI